MKLKLPDNQNQYMVVKMQHANWWGIVRSECTGKDNWNQPKYQWSVIRWEDNPDKAREFKNAIETVMAKPVEEFCEQII